MKLNSNSLNAKLYCWFYGKHKEYDLPKSLCPYFWKLALAWLLLVPYAIFCAPFILIFEAFDKSYTNGDNKIGERIGISFFMYVFLFSLFALVPGVVALFVTIKKGTLFHNMLPGSVMLWLFLILSGIYQGFKYFIKKIRESKEAYTYDEYGYRVYAPKKANLVVEFFKAKYNRYCPKIDWVNNDVNQNDNQ